MRDIITKENETTVPVAQPVRLGPTLPSKRIQALDVLRGVAIMGILVANIQIFAMIKIAEFNPSAYGDMTGLNYIIAMLGNILVSRKFMTIFTMLFGAGVILMTERLEAKGEKPAKRHFPRMFWLFVIGSLNTYIFSPGEVLSFYAVCGLVLFFCRKLSAKKLLIYGLICLCLPTILDLSFQVRARSPQGLAAQEAAWKPGVDRVKEEIDLYTGPWLKQIEYRLKTRQWFLSYYFYAWGMWSFLGRMLLGMALFKWGILTAKAATKTYKKLLYFGLGIGLLTCIAGWLYNESIDWYFFKSQLTGGQFNEWGGPILALGIISAVMLICRAGKLKRLTNGLAAVGRMALTNFLMHAVFCFFIFHYPGLALKGNISRSGQILIVFAIWIVQFYYSSWWLKHFRFGPAEWLWRSLTYWKRQPMRRV